MKLAPQTGLNFYIEFLCFFPMIWRDCAILCHLVAFQVAKSNFCLPFNLGSATRDHCYFSSFFLSFWFISFLFLAFLCNCMIRDQPCLAFWHSLVSCLWSGHPVIWELVYLSNRRWTSTHWGILSEHVRTYWRGDSTIFLQSTALRSVNTVLSCKIVPCLLGSVT